MFSFTKMFNDAKDSSNGSAVHRISAAALKDEDGSHFKTIYMNTDEASTLQPRSKSHSFQHSIAGMHSSTLSKNDDARTLKICHTTAPKRNKNKVISKLKLRDKLNVAMPHVSNYLSKIEKIEVRNQLLDHYILNDRCKCDEIFNSAKSKNIHFRHFLRNGVLCWSIGRETYEGIISLLAWLYNIDLNKSAEKLANMLNVRLDYFFSIYEENNDCVTCIDANSYEYLIRKDLILHDTNYRLVDAIKFKNIDGSDCSCVYVYKSHVGTKLVPASVFYINRACNYAENTKYQRYIGIGFRPFSSVLLNRNCIALNPHATIILSCDLTIAHNLSELVKESILISDNDIVVSGYYDDGSCILPHLGDIADRNVIIVFGSGSEQYQKAVELALQCEEKNASEVLIYTKQIYGKYSSDEDTSHELLDGLQLQNQSIDLGVIESPSLLVKDIMSNSLNVECFIDFGYTIGVFKTSDNTESSLQASYELEPIHIKSASIGEAKTRDVSTLAILDETVCVGAYQSFMEHRIVGRALLHSLLHGQWHMGWIC